MYRLSDGSPEANGTCELGRELSYLRNLEVPMLKAEDMPMFEA